MIQRTQLNKISISKIQEEFVGNEQQTDEELKQYLSQWTNWVRIGQTANRSFYISVNKDYKVDGILLDDGTNGSATLFARSAEVVQNLLIRASRDTHFSELAGDAKSLHWAEGISLK